MKVSQYRKFQELQLQSQKPSSAMMKLAIMRTITGKEDPELPLLQRISSLELPASEIVAQINTSEFRNGHISTSTVQRRLCESGLHGWIAAKKPQLNDTNKKKRRAGGNLSFGLTSTNLRLRVGEQMISACVVPYVKQGRRRFDGVGLFFWWHCQWYI